MPTSAPAPPLKILSWVRPDLNDWSGGDTIQVNETARALKKLGVDITVSHDPQQDLQPFDCIHLWHLERVHDSYYYLEQARAAGKPVVLSTIYWPEDHKPRIFGNNAPAWIRGCRENLKNLVRIIMNPNPGSRMRTWTALRTGWATCRQRLLEGVEVLLPNSHAEADIISRESRRELCVMVVPNAVNPEAYPDINASSPAQPARAPAMTTTAQGMDILCVGHFCIRKNQLWLIQALAGTDIRISFIGTARRMHQGYFRQCLKQARDRHEFHGSMPREKVLAAMRRAGVHVCASRFETPGLVNLEAALMGCNLVVPECAPIREYLQEHAFYFRHDSAKSLHQAIHAAMSAPPPIALQKRILTHYTWQNAAKTTLRAYGHAISAFRRQYPAIADTSETGYDLKQAES